jgi:hypothetical protein
MLTVKSYPALTAFFGLDIEGGRPCRDPDSADDSAVVDDKSGDNSAGADACKRGSDGDRERDSERDSIDKYENQRETKSSGRDGGHVDEDEGEIEEGGASRYRTDRLTPLSGGVIVFSSKPSPSSSSTLPTSTSRSTCAATRRSSTRT